MNIKKTALAAALAIAASAWSQPIVHLKTGGAKQATPGTVRGHHYIIQFGSYPGAELRNELANRGIRVLQYVPDNSLMVSSGASADLSGLPVVETGSLDSSQKISPLLAEQVAGSVLAIFHSDLDAASAEEIVRSLGFDVVTVAGLLANQLVIAGPIGRLPALAAFDEVAYLLPASADLSAGASVAGCAGAVVEAGSIGEYSLVSKGWQKDASGNVALRYFIRSVTEKIDANIARAEIERAIKEWTRYANLSFTQGPQGGPRTIDIQFGRGAHGDTYPFDGPGRALAHTFYPAYPNPEPIAGDMHLDSDEAWRTGAGIDLYSVALHEAGHALGLGHSDRPGTVMYPYYRQFSGLSDDDVDAIRALYGAAATTQTPAVTTPVTPPTTPVTPVTPTVTPVTPPTTPVTPTVTTPGADTLAPSLQIKSPAFTIVSTTGASIPVGGVAADNVAVTRVQWATSSGETGTASGVNSWSASVPLLKGTNVITIRAYDAAGNSGWRSVTVVRR